MGSQRQSSGFRPGTFKILTQLTEVDWLSRTGGSLARIHGRDLWSW